MPSEMPSAMPRLPAEKHLVVFPGLNTDGHQGTLSPSSSKAVHKPWKAYLSVALLSGDLTSSGPTMLESGITFDSLNNIHIHKALHSTS